MRTNKSWENIKEVQGNSGLGGQSRPLYFQVWMHYLMEGEKRGRTFQQSRLREHDIPALVEMVHCG